MKKLFFALAGIAAACCTVKHFKKEIIQGIGKQFTPEKKAKHMINHLDNVLDLTYGQKDQLLPVFTGAMEGIHGKSESATAFFTFLKEDFTGDEFDEAKFTKAVKKDLIDEKVGYISGFISQLHGILTKEQRERLIKHIEEKKAKFSCCHPGMGHGIQNNCC